jgi:hypothetical protein
VEEEVKKVLLHIEQHIIEGALIVAVLMAWSTYLALTI